MRLLTLLALLVSFAARAENTPIIIGNCNIAYHVANETAGVAFTHDSKEADGLGAGFMGMLTHHHRGAWKGMALTPFSVSTPVFGQAAYWYDNSGVYPTRMAASASHTNTGNVGDRPVPPSGVSGFTPMYVWEMKFTGIQFAARVNPQDNNTLICAMINQPKLWRGGVLPYAGKTCTWRGIWYSHADGIPSFSMCALGEHTGYLNPGTVTTGLSALGSGTLSSADVTCVARASPVTANWGPALLVEHESTDAIPANKYLDWVGCYVKWQSTGLHVLDFGNSGYSLYNYLDDTACTAANLQRLLDLFEIDTVVVTVVYNDCSGAIGHGPAISTRAEIEARLSSMIARMEPSVLYGKRNFILIPPYDTTTHAVTGAGGAVELNNANKRLAFLNVQASHPSNTMMVDWYSLLPDNTILSASNVYPNGVGGTESYTVDGVHISSHWLASQMNVAWNACLETAAQTARSFRLANSNSNALKP
jgi:hypothetical protein